jgi:hypothetical protein
MSIYTCVHNTTHACTCPHHACGERSSATRGSECIDGHRPEQSSECTSAQCRALLLLLLLLPLPPSDYQPWLSSSRRHPPPPAVCVLLLFTAHSSPHTTSNVTNTTIPECNSLHSLALCAPPPALSVCCAGSTHASPHIAATAGAMPAAAQLCPLLPLPCGVCVCVCICDCAYSVTAVLHNTSCVISHT